MGLCVSTDRAIERQEKYVRARMKEDDMVKISQMRGSLFHGKDARKYNDNQIRGYLRQEYHGTRKHNNYVLDSDIPAMSGSSKRHYK